MTTSFRRACLTGAFWAVGLGTLTAKPVAILPGLQRDGSVLLSNQWSLRPIGKQIPVGDFPVNIAVHPDGHFAAVLHCGHGTHEVVVLDLREEKIISRATLNEAFYGVTFSMDARTLFCSGAADEVIHRFSFK